MSLLIEAARTVQGTSRMLEAAARAREEELLQIRGMYARMFSDCMSLLRAAPDPAPYYPGWMVPWSLIENLMVKYWGTDKRITREWQDDTGYPVEVVLDGWPLHRNDPYAKLGITGLRQSCRMYRDPDTGQIKGRIIDASLHPHKYRTEGEVTVQEVAEWRRMVDFLKSPLAS